MLELYLSNKHIRGNSSSVEFSRVSSTSQRTTQVSWATSPSRLGGSASRQMSV
jgi:hypothetical protein